jgi:hypothetical protein
LLVSLAPTTGLFISFCVGAGVESTDDIVQCDRAGPFEGYDTKTRGSGRNLGS